MPHLETELTVARDMHQLLGTWQRIGQRLLDERVQIALQHRQSDVYMRRRRDDDSHCLDTIQQRVQ